MTWLILGNTFASVLGEVIKSWLGSESITSTRTMHCRNPTLWAWRQWLGRWIWNWQGQWAPSPLSPPEGNWAGWCTGSHVMRQASVQHQHSGCLQVLFVSSRLVFSVQHWGCLWGAVRVQQAGVQHSGCLRGAACVHVLQVQGRWQDGLPDRT